MLRRDYLLYMLQQRPPAYRAGQDAGPERMGADATAAETRKGSAGCSDWVLMVPRIGADAQDPLSSRHALTPHPH
jgi:hypothetical protein